MYAFPICTKKKIGTIDEHCGANCILWLPGLLQSDSSMLPFVHSNI